jgi:hypothetical protein
MKLLDISMVNTEQLHLEVIKDLKYFNHLFQTNWSKSKVYLQYLPQLKLYHFDKYQ